MSTALEDTEDSSSGMGFWQKKREQSDTAHTSTTASGELNTAGCHSL